MTLKTAFILAAGVGSRMLGSINYPKAMIKVNNKTLIEYLIEDFYEHGISKFVINTHYKAEMLENFILSLPIAEKITIKFSREDERLETAGGIKNALSYIDEENFFVANTDVFCLTNTKSAINTLVDRWNPEEMDELLLLIPRTKTFGYHGDGDFNLIEQSIIQRSDIVPRDYVYIGMQIIKKDFFNDVPVTKYSFLEAWMKRQLPNNVIDKVKAAIFDGEWLHIGDPESKAKAENHLNAIKNKLV